MVFGKKDMDVDSTLWGIAVVFKFQTMMMLVSDIWGIIIH